MKQQQQNKHVHVVFKSHLDIGFTNLAQRVVDQYMNDYIPRALDLIDQLHESPIGFTWTTGSWMIKEFLERSSSSFRRRMERAISERNIRWHAMPFTLHSELATADLFSAGLQISKDLDKQFGVETIAGKCTDVPGHTQAIIPLLAAYGIRFLHIGTNPACIPAEVPSLFRWRSPDGSEVVVNYQTGYGNITEFDETQSILWFAHQQDNEQPPSIEKLHRLYKQLQNDYPDAHIAASGIDDFARGILPYAEKLPVVDQEIGDTWIHGAGTDPYKIARYRALCRFTTSVGDRELSPEETTQLKAMKEKLLLIPEHTWGMDLKRYLPDYLNYRKEDFQQARSDDIIPASVQTEGERTYLPPMETDTNPVDQPGSRTYSEFESSWKEQRAFIGESLACLHSDWLKAEADTALHEVEPNWIPIDQTTSAGFTALSMDEPLQYKDWTLSFSPETGALVSLRHEGLSYDLCQPGGALGQFRYEVYSEADYRQFYGRYLLKDANHYAWSLPDYTKPGLGRLTDLSHTVYTPSKPAGFVRTDDCQLEVRMYTTMPVEASTSFGAPRELLTRIQADKESNTVAITLHWRGKDANRIPESSWLGFDLNTGKTSTCFLDKMGMNISPQSVVRNGNRALHAVTSGVTIRAFDDTQKAVTISLDSRDAPLVSIGKPRILQFDQRLPRCDEGLYVNLHNNLWGTNFPMWYSDDGMFKFTLTLRR
ncbi:MAG: DUF5054 domain-containing protein [Spirochaetota bacterium]